MDLRNNSITLGEILKNPEAKELLHKELPQYFNNPMLMGMARGMSLTNILGIASGMISKEKQQELLTKLKAI